MIKRMVVAAVALIASVAAVPVATQIAGAYPPGGPCEPAVAGLMASPTTDLEPCPTTVVTDSSVYKPKTTVIITANGFAACAGQTVTFTITLPAGVTVNGSNIIVVSAIANPQGVATTSVTAPNFSGTYTVVASATSCPPASTTFVVRNLPAAGSNTLPWVVSAAAAVAVGLFFLLVARRRRRPAH